MKKEDHDNGRPTQEVQPENAVSRAGHRWNSSIFFIFFACLGHFQYLNIKDLTAILNGYASRNPVALAAGQDWQIKMGSPSHQNSPSFMAENFNTGLNLQKPAKYKGFQDYIITAFLRKALKKPPLPHLFINSLLVEKPVL